MSYNPFQAGEPNEIASQILSLDRSTSLGFSVLREFEIQQARYALIVFVGLLKATKQAYNLEPILNLLENPKIIYELLDSATEDVKMSVTIFLNQFKTNTKPGSFDLVKWNEVLSPLIKLIKSIKKELAETGIKINSLIGFNFERALLNNSFVSMALPVGDNKITASLLSVVLYDLWSSISNSYKALKLSSGPAPFLILIENFDSYDFESTDKKSRFIEVAKSANIKIVSF